MKKYLNVAFILRPLYIVSKRLYYIQIEGSIYYYNYIIYIINIYLNASFFYFVHRQGNNYI